MSETICLREPSVSSTSSRGELGCQKVPLEAERVVLQDFRLLDTLATWRWNPDFQEEQQGLLLACEPLLPRTRHSRIRITRIAYLALSPIPHDRRGGQRAAG